MSVLLIINGVMQMARVNWGSAPKDSSQEYPASWCQDLVRLACLVVGPVCLKSWLIRVDRDLNCTQWGVMAQGSLSMGGELEAES